MEKVTFENLPNAVSQLMAEVGEIKRVVLARDNPVQRKRLPIEIDEASRIIHKSKSTIYSLVRKKTIPCYKVGKKLYFYEDELLNWIGDGRKKSIQEMREEIENQMQSKSRINNRFNHF